MTTHNWVKLIKKNFNKIPLDIDQDKMVNLLGIGMDLQKLEENQLNLYKATNSGTVEINKKVVDSIFFSNLLLQSSK